MGTLVQSGTRQILSGSSNCSSTRHLSLSLGAARSSSPANATQTKRNNSSTASACALELDSEIWSNLQPELVARILALLPLTALILTRLVSQRYDREIYSGRILGAASGSDGSSGSRRRLAGWLFLIENNGGPGNYPHCKLHAFDPARNDWQTLITTLPAPFATTVQKIGGLALCGGASGLMVFAIRAVKSGFVRLGVFNPVTRSWKKLPPLLSRRQQPVVSVFVVPNYRGLNREKYYKVVVAGGMEYGEQVGTTEVYDSRTECWQMTCEKFSNQASHVSEEMRTSTAFCDGTVYHLRFNQMLSFDPHRENHTFMTYSTKTRRWRPLRTALPPDLVFTEYPSLKRIWKGQVHTADILPPVLVESDNRLLLIGFREDRPSDSSVTGAAIWEFVVATRAWRGVSAVPEPLFQRVLSPAVRGMGVAGATDASEYLRYELQATALGATVFVFRPAGGVLVCDLASNPPTWRCVRKNVIGGDGAKGCVIDLRLDTLI